MQGIMGSACFFVTKNILRNGIGNYSKKKKFKLCSIYKISFFFEFILTDKINVL